MEAPSAAIFPPEQTFLLSSRASATKTIYLDFDGHTTSGTAWNTNFTGGRDIVTPAYNIDGSPAFSDTELLYIQNVWTRVAEAFSPFDVNVTTQEPPLDDLRKVGTNDQRWGIRAVIGGNNSWYKPGTGGVAFVGSFSRNSDTPTFVFSENVSNGNPKQVADAVSHEVGHTLGLSHDGRSSPSEGYYFGHGSGPTGWAPIMGAGYSRQLVQWSKGEYLNANNQQDDLAIIVGTATTPSTPNGNGFGYRPDDHGDAPATATQYIGSDLAGVIEQNTDVDVFRFYTTRRAVIDVRPWQHGPMLDILAELVDASGNVIATSNPADNLDASFDTTLSTGVYYLRVQGTGKGDPLDTGYTDYGSLGQYTVSLTVDARPAIASVDDRVGTIQGSVSTGGRTNDPQPMVSGTGSPGSTVTLTAGSLTLGAASVAPDGTWSIVVSPPLPDGTYQLLVGDSFGGSSEDAFQITVDTLAPSTPVLVSVIDDVGLTQGLLPNGGRTDDTELRLAGTAAAGSRVTVFGNGIALGSATADGGGSWTFTTPRLNAGTYAFTITASDDVGNESTPTTPAFSVTVDTTLPAAPTITGIVDAVLPNTGSVPNGGYTNDVSPSISGTGEPGTTVRIASGGTLVGQGTVGGAGVWRVIPSSPLAAGTYSLVAVASTAIGTESGSSAAFIFTVDTTPPTLAITRSGTGPLSIGKTAVITFTVTEPVTTFDRTDVAVTGGTLSSFSGSGAVYTATFVPTAGFQGTASIAVRAAAFTDPAGYANPAASLQIPIDTIRPTVTLTRTGASQLLAGATAVITFRLSEPVANFGLASVAVSGGRLTNLRGSGTLYTATFVPATQFRGTATIAVPAGRVTDLAGNGNLAGSPLALTVDTVAPLIIGFRASPATARLGIGGSVVLIADFSEPVTPSGGTVTVILDSGGQAVLTVDASGRIAKGTYTAQAGQTTPDLDVVGIAAAGGLRNAAGNPLGVTLPPPAAGLAARHAIVVDAAVKLVSNGVFSADPAIVRDAGAQYRQVPIRFTTPVAGVSLASFAVSLDGRPLSLQGAVLQGQGAGYSLLLPLSRLNSAGIYTLSIRPGSGIRATSNGAAASVSTTLRWGHQRSVGMVPDAPRSPTPLGVIQAGVRTSVVLGWPVPKANGGGAVTGYQVEYRRVGTSRWLAIRDRIPASASPTATISGLIAGQRYEFRVAARNAAGLGEFAVSTPFTVDVTAGPTTSRTASR